MQPLLDHEMRTLSQQRSFPDGYIAHKTFRSLPVEVQADYARFYNLPDVERLTSYDICRGLFKESEWIQSQEIEGHVKIDTRDGCVVARSVMDLVEWLIQHCPEGVPPTTLSAEDAGHPSHSRNRRPHEEQGHGDLRQLATDIQRTHLRLTTTVMASRRIMREACADTFIVQNQLREEMSYHEDVIRTLTGIVGIGVMQRIREEVDRGRPQDLGQGRKRKRTAATSQHDFHRLKKPKLDETTTQDPVPPPRTILNYSSNGEGTDSTYSDSNGTEADFVDDPYSYYEFCQGRRRIPRDALPAFNFAQLSTDEDSDTSTDLDLADLDNDDDSDDPDYQPPDWDLEDVWEIENSEFPRDWDPHPLYLFKPAEELVECGGLLSDSLSTDDSDREYQDLRVTQRKSQPPAASLGPLLTVPKHKMPRALGRWQNGLDENYYARHQAQVKAEDKQKRWDDFLTRLYTGRVPPLNVEQRLINLLDTDYWEYYFDDEEWRFMERPRDSPKDA